MRTSIRVALAGLVVAATACGPAVDLTKGLQILDVSTGWLDAGIVDGNNKLVPSLRFKLKNVSSETLHALQVNAVFRPLTDDKEWGTRFRIVSGSDGLAAGATTDTVTLPSDHGVTGSDPRQDLLKNSRFVDARVQLFAKYGSISWVRLAEYPVTRELITN